MTPMVSVLKTIAEALIRLLTMLLQILVQQLEKQEILAEMEIENEPETHAHLQDMMRQIQQQGATLEALCQEVSVQKKGPEKKVRPQPAAMPMSVSSLASGSSTPMSRPQIPSVNLSLINISEPTRQLYISYAVFFL
jgi:DNA-binding protein H-NS